MRRGAYSYTLVCDFSLYARSSSAFASDENDISFSLRMRRGAYSYTLVCDFSLYARSSSAASASGSWRITPLRQAATGA